jgi:hypothetical protein
VVHTEAAHHQHPLKAVSTLELIMISLDLTPPFSHHAGMPVCVIVILIETGVMRHRPIWDL